MITEQKVVRTALFSLVLDYNETISIIIYFLHEHTATLILRKVKAYGIITSYTEKLLTFFIEWGLFGPQGMLNRVKRHTTVHQNKQLKRGK